MDVFEKKCKVECNEVLGRYIVAATDIKAGETILLEQPVLLVAFSNEKRCANCLKLTDKFCSTCHVFSLCDNCALHNAYDCKLFAGMKELQVAELQKHNDVYGPLKCLLLRENAETAAYFEQMLQMEAHMEQRRDTPIWQEHQQEAVTPILQSHVAKYLTNGQQIDAELLQRLCGIIDVNCFEVRGPDMEWMRGMYIRAALAAHSCVANTAVSIGEQYQLKMYATQDVAKGEILYYCYTNVLLGTDERRQLLKVGKYFDCTCVRCEDPTELGSHMSSLVCVRCADNKRMGYLVRETPTEQSAQVSQQQRQPKPKPPQWKCQLCAHTMSAENVEKLLERTKEEIFHAKDDIYRYELLLAKLGRYLHPHHYLLLDLKQNIAAILRSIIQNLAMQPGRKVYERKVQLCEEILAVLQIIQPGISRLKAIVLYELANTAAELQRMRFEAKEITAKQLVEHLKSTQSMLRESIRMLLYEPPETPEGQMAKGMLKELKELQGDMLHLQQNQLSGDEL